MGPIASVSTPAAFPDVPPPDPKLPNRPPPAPRVSARGHEARSQMTADPGARVRAVQAPAPQPRRCWRSRPRAQAAEADRSAVAAARGAASARRRPPDGGRPDARRRRSDEQERLIRVATRLERRVARVQREQPRAPAPARRGAGGAARARRAAARASCATRGASARWSASPSRRSSRRSRPASPAATRGAIGGGGLYRGKYQFDLETWASVGGSGDPAAASEAEQDMRAAMLYARAGAAPWPVCGR